MKLDITLLHGAEPVPYAPAAQVDAATLDGGAVLLHEVGGPAGDRIEYLHVSHVVVSLVGGGARPWSKAFPVSAAAGVVPIRRGATARIVWTRVHAPVIVTERYEEAVGLIRAWIDGAEGEPTPSE